jgi:hypothetical protein
MVSGELDLAYGIPIGVHSSQIITDSNGSGQYCPGTNKPIHRAASKCDTSNPYDQDKLGGSLAGTSCANTQTSYPGYYGPHDFDADGANDVQGSFIKDDATLFKLFGLRSPALTTTQIDQLRTIAQSQGNYWTGSSGWTSPNEANAVMFFDLSQTNPGGTVNLNNVTGFGRASNVADTGGACESKSLVIVVDGGNVKLNSNQQLFGSLFLTSGAPYGQVQKANGNASFIGTIYADVVNLVGTIDLSMDGCFLANFSPALLDLTTENYREEDRGLS